jgi:hypothetical protein
VTRRGKQAIREADVRKYEFLEVPIYRSDDFSIMNPSTKFLTAALYAGMAASVLSTVAQILLWWLCWDALPTILYRDARFAAAIILGQEVLPPPATLDWQVMLIATGIHIGLSILYAIVLSWLIRSLTLKASLIAGGLFGLGLFTVNMYGFVSIFPWFVETRDWITIAAHIVFGISAAAVYKVFAR